MESSVRDVILDGAHNVRDLGGLATRQGGTTKFRQVFRSAALHGLTDDGRHALNLLGIRTIIDLRSFREAESVGRVTDLPSWVDLLVMPINDVPWSPTQADEIVDPSEFLVESYRRILEKEASTLAAAVVAVAEDGRRPAVIHCTAGKDRTGLVCALLLDILGVCPEAIAADYALTARAMPAVVAQATADRPQLAKVLGSIAKVYLASPEEAMAETLRDLASRGGVEAYLVDAGARPQTLQHLRDVLVMDG